MFQLLPTTLLTLLFALPALSHASPQPALVGSDYAISLIPRHTLFLRQLADLQTFDQALGGVKASAITNSGDAQRPFSVDGSTFDKFESAAQRSCDAQFQGCQRAANGNNNNNNNNNNGGGNNANANANGRNQQKQQSGNNGGGNNNNGQNNGGNNQQNKNNGQNNNGNNGDKNKDRKQKRQDGGGLTVQQCDQQKSTPLFLSPPLLFSSLFLY
jgi:hypothetical protein